MDGSESGNDVVFCSAYISFSEVGAVIVGGDELYNTRRCGGAEKRFDFGGGWGGRGHLPKDLTSAEDGSTNLSLRASARS